MYSLLLYTYIHNLKTTRVYVYKLKIINIRLKCILFNNTFVSVLYDQQNTVYPPKNHNRTSSINNFQNCEGENPIRFGSAVKLKKSEFW